MDGLLSLAMTLFPDAPVTVDVRRVGHDAVVDALCPMPERPVRGHRRPDLARLTRAREQWSQDFWLWRAVARSGGGRLALVHDHVGPIGIRLFLRV